MATMRPGSGEDLHITVAARLREDGQRYTAGRRSLVDALAAATQPLTIAEITAAAGMPQSSAYRNLGVLERAAVVHRLVTDEEFARYELAQDLTHHHHHLVCTSCGSVVDVTIPADVESAVERALDA